MKKLIILFLAGIFTLTSCEKMLDTDPTDRVSGTAIFADAQNAMTAVNGIYRMLYSGNWGSSWQPENGGLPAYILVFDLMAEDHVMDNAGSGWFWYDYGYDIWGDYTGKAGHQYQMWNFFYTMISNANYIIAQEGQIPGDENLANYAMAQAYAIRSFAYMWLVQGFQQNDPNKPGVPLYSEPTIAGSTGNPRGTVKLVYDQANSDINKAIELFEASNVNQMHISHIDKYVAYGIKARHALVQKDYQTALDAAKKAMESPKTIADFNDIRHVNNSAARNAMWGLAIQSDQSLGSWDIYSHMDPTSMSTYSRARHLISSWLYDQIPENDSRLAWWTAPLPADQWGAPGTINGDKRSWTQTKLVFSNASTQEGDHVLMRKEEIALMAAEASAHLGNFSEARNYVSMVGSKRMPNYAERLGGFTDSKSYNTNTTGPLSTLMDEILFQRRVELWSEVPRLFDLQRLGLGFNRSFEGSNHLLKIPTVNTGPASPAFIFWIPQAEFDGNENMDPAQDQNPNPRG